MPKDYVISHMYFNLAFLNGKKGAAKAMSVVEKEMTPSQIEKARSLAREWIATYQ